MRQNRGSPIVNVSRVHFSQKKYQNWSTEAEIIAIYCTEECKIVFAQGFYGFFTIFTFIFYAWPFLVYQFIGIWWEWECLDHSGYHNIMLSGRIDIVITRMILAYIMRVEMVKHQKKPLIVKTSTLFDLENVHTFSFSWPTLMIFVVNIMLSHMWIDSMITRMTQA